MCTPISNIKCPFCHHINDNDTIVVICIQSNTKNSPHHHITQKNDSEKFGKYDRYFDEASIITTFSAIPHYMRLQRNKIKWKCALLLSPSLLIEVEDNSSVLCQKQTQKKSRDIMWCDAVFPFHQGGIITV